MKYASTRSVTGLVNFLAFGVKTTEWDIKCKIQNKTEIKNYDLKNLKLGRSAFDIVITANYPTHNSKGNKKGNILTAMSGGAYIPKLHFNPTETPSKEQIIDKLENNEKPIGMESVSNSFKMSNSTKDSIPILRASPTLVLNL